MNIQKLSMMSITSLKLIIIIIIIIIINIAGVVNGQQQQQQRQRSSSTTTLNVKKNIKCNRTKFENDFDRLMVVSHKERKFPENQNELKKFCQ
mgnify:CR=1 FL=1